MPQNMNESDKVLYFDFLFDLECRLGIGCVGALLKFLNSSRRVNNNQTLRFEIFQNAFPLNSAPILSVRPVNLDKLLILDANAFKSLEIFSDVDFTCAFKQTNSFSSGNFRTCLNDKSVNTIYGLFLSKIRTRMGISKLRSVMLKPTRDKSILDERHRFVEFFANSRNQSLVQYLNTSLKSCKYIGPTLKRMKTAKCNLTDWKRLLSTTQAFLNIIYVSRVINEQMEKSIHMF